MLRFPDVVQTDSMTFRAKIAADVAAAEKRMLEHREQWKTPKMGSHAWGEDS